MQGFTLTLDHQNLISLSLSTRGHLSTIYYVYETYTWIRKQTFLWPELQHMYIKWQDNRYFFRPVYNHGITDTKTQCLSPNPQSLRCMWLITFRPIFPQMNTTYTHTYTCLSMPSSQNIATLQKVHLWCANDKKMQVISYHTKIWIYKYENMCVR